MIKGLILLSFVLMASANMRRDWNDNHNDNNNNYNNNYNDNNNYKSYDDYSQPIPYSFGYDVKDDHGLELTRKESGDGHGAVTGSYSYRDNHGIERRVEYIADKGGFRARVHTNEPGTAKSRPADVEMDANPIIVDSRHYGSDNKW